MLIAILPLLLVLQQPPAKPSALGTAEQLLRENRYEDAIRELRATLEREPQSGEAVWVLLARCYESVGKPEDALP